MAASSATLGSAEPTLYAGAPLAGLGYSAALAAPLGYAAPAALAAPLGYAAPAALAAPLSYAAPVALAAPVAASTLSQSHEQDELGQYQFGYNAGNSARTETKTADGVVSGSYSYIDGNGITQQVNYVADALGFRTVGTNLPVAAAAY